MAEEREPKCCCGCIGLDKGVMMIGMVLLFELCATFGNFKTMWFVAFLKLILLCFLVNAFCNLDSSRIRKYLYVSYIIFSIIEGVLLILWCATRVFTNLPELECQGNLEDEGVVEFMQQNDLSELEYLQGCA